MKTKKIDLEKKYSKKEFINKLRRLSDSLEKGNKFSIQVAGNRINIPKDAVINIELEKGKEEVELEFQVKWKI